MEGEGGERWGGGAGSTRCPPPPPFPPGRTTQGPAPPCVSLQVGMMRDGSPEAREAATGAISNLACVAGSTQAAIVRAGAVPVLLRLMGAGVGAGCQETAARAFGNLCVENSDAELVGGECRAAAGWGEPGAPSCSQ